MDAWEQLATLVNRFTTRTQVREDIEVVARATERGVELILWDLPKKPFGLKTDYSTTHKRNVSTMRELAQAIIDACDFVDESNPEWAERAEASRDEIWEIRE